MPWDLRCRRLLARRVVVTTVEIGTLARGRGLRLRVVVIVVLDTTIVG